MPVLYYIRHGETDWNVEQRLQGHRDTALNARGRGQAAIAATFCATCWSATDAPQRLLLRVEPALPRAADHGAGSHRTRSRSARLWRRQSAHRNFVRRLGRPDACRDHGARRRGAGGARAGQVGLYATRRRELSRRDGARRRLVRVRHPRHRGHRAWRRGARADRVFHHSTARRSRPRRHRPRRRLRFRRRHDGAVLRNSTRHCPAG